MNAGEELDVLDRNYVQTKMEMGSWPHKYCAFGGS